MKNSIHERTLESIQELIYSEENRASKDFKRLKDLCESKKIDCCSSLTQLHILSLIVQRPNQLYNAMLSKLLNISKPGITKAIRFLLERQLISVVDNCPNEKEVRFKATIKGEKLENIHKKLHAEAQSHYETLFKHFSDSELNVVIRFLNYWSKVE